MRLKHLPSEFQEALPVLRKLRQQDLKLILLAAVFVMSF